MKKSITYVIASIMIVACFAIFGSPDVYAYELKYKAVVDGEKIRIEMPVKSHSGESTIREWGKNVGGLGTTEPWNLWGNANAIAWSTESYGSYLFGFHTKPLSVITNDASNPSKSLAYVSYSGTIDTKTSVVQNNTTEVDTFFNNMRIQMATDISKAKGGEYGLRFEKVNPAGNTNNLFQLNRNKDATINLAKSYFHALGGNKNQNLVFSQFILNEEAVQEVLDYAEANNTPDEIYFSSALAGGNSGEFKSETAADMVNYVKTYGYDPRNWGISWPQDIQNALASAINYYDNKLILTEVPREKVRTDYMYRDKEGNQVRIKGTWEDIGTDGNTIKKDDNKIKKLNGSNGYIGYTKASGNTKSVAAKNATNTKDAKGSKAESTITVKRAQNNKKTNYTIVTYYYDYTKAITEYKSDKNDIKEATARNYKTSSEIKLGGTGSIITEDGVKYNFLKNNITIRSNWVTKLDSAKKNARISGNVITPNDGTKNMVLGEKINIVKKYELEPAKQVYIRHLVYNEDKKVYELNKKLTNGNEKIYDGASKEFKLVNNGYNQRGGTTNIPKDCNEAFTIDYADTMYIDRSRSLRVDGIDYQYQGYKNGDSSKSNDYLKILTDSNAVPNKTISTVTIKNTNKVKVEYVDFYYKTVDVPPPGIDEDGDSDGDEDENPGDDPELEFTPKTVDGTIIGNNIIEENKGCKVVYVPSGENLKTYMSAITHRAYTLVYEADKVDAKTGKLYYNLKEYQAYKYTGGVVVKNNNPTSSLQKAIGTDKESVFSSNTNLNVTVNAALGGGINEVLTASRDDLKKKSPLSITKISDGRRTTTADFPDNSNTHGISENKYNGLRIPEGIANYDVVTLVSGGKDANATPIKGIEVKTNTNTRINVFTPLVLGNPVIKSSNAINHSDTADGFTIQKNSTFTVTPKTGKSTDYLNMDNTDKYVNYYWVKFDFDIKLTDRSYETFDGTNRKTVGANGAIPAETFIKINKGDSITAIATSSKENEGDKITGLKNSIKIIGVTYNMEGGSLENAILEGVTSTSTSDKNKYIDTSFINKVTTGCESTEYKQTHSAITSSGVHNMYADAKYMAQSQKWSRNLSRIYDFKITDCLDVNFKNVFRKQGDSQNVNDLTGMQYFAGVKQLKIYNGVNVLVNRTNIDQVPSKMILPLGPQKHTAKNYLQAPKMGYRISFDLKTSGTYIKNSDNADPAKSPKREIRITPSYYFIGKDGTYKPNITLYYKNSSGKYAKFNGSNYTIYFKPNDGYRMDANKLETDNLNGMSTKLESLQVGGEYFTLTDSMMASSQNNFIQSWYGEFKLPNSTIAVGEDGDINKPLTNGYIGVKFKMECITKDTPGTEITPENKKSGSVVVVGYGNNDLTQTVNTNTSQWDYESYLGFNNIGKELSQKLKIVTENGSFTIDKDQVYQAAKGTVALFDVDNRAANDFE